jgi:hypothetical protein
LTQNYDTVCSHLYSSTTNQARGGILRPIGVRSDISDTSNSRGRRNLFPDQPNRPPLQDNPIAAAAIRRQEESELALATKRSQETHLQEEEARLKRFTSMCEVIDLSIDKHKSSESGALIEPTPRPHNLSAIDTGFITDPAPQPRYPTTTPIANTTQRNPMAAINTNNDISDAQAVAVGSLMQRALRRSFGEALRLRGEGNANMITNEEVRVAQLTEAFIDDCNIINEAPDSPGLCDMLDLFREP